MYNFEELNQETRKWMLQEFLGEERSGNPYRSTRLSPIGLIEFPREMETAIRSGNEDSLAQALSNPTYWNPDEVSHRQGRPYTRQIDPDKTAQVLAFTEFNTWYVRGFARRLIEEGVINCEVYRAAPALEPRQECLLHEDLVYPVRDIYNGHRVRYWPSPGNPDGFSIPIGPYCHHSIKRTRR